MVLVTWQGILMSFLSFRDFQQNSILVYLDTLPLQYVDSVNLKFPSNFSFLL